MTREEAIEFIAQSVKSDVDMAMVADALKAIEQKPILDKIRAEIEQLPITDTAVRLVDEILDKYKSESGDK